ncbi:hypothetical protein ACHAQJ_008046 [Trichoderma viride]
MRLLECSGANFTLTKDLVGDVPQYAILSHKWGPDSEEVTFRDLVDHTGVEKVGFKKLSFCAEQAKRDGIQFFWVDTCCIDKSNNNELTEAINSMFRYYRNASRCYVYLSDVSTTGYEDNNHKSELAWESAFRASRWFTRGWTLQELLAPGSVEFFTQDGRRLGDKRSLEQQIHEITGIAVPALQGGELSHFHVEERLKWAETRHTTREEDWAYCLLGIFGVFMPLIYGEGKANAVRRFKKEIADAMKHGDAPNHLRARNHTWIVPFERNPSFSGREVELKRLQQALFTGHQTAKLAITGLGGVGKTQLVLEFVYQVAAEHNASLGISGLEDDKADVKRLVQGHLSSESAGQWFLVFDNADDINMWTDRHQQESGCLIDYLPRSSRGSIIFTTRDKKAAVKLAGRNIVEMSEMDEADAKQLLQKYLIDQDLIDSQGDVTTLLARLTNLPLAIVQAAAYINGNGIGLGEYLLLLEEQEEDVIDLLSEEFEDERRYPDINSPVATTWLISFEQIRQRDPLAANYLSFMACIGAKDIPQSLLPPGQSRKKEIDAMGTLQGYSFIAKQSADMTINIHRLVHLATRNWLRKEELLSHWSGAVIARLTEVLADIDRDKRVVWRPYMPHAYYALGSSLASDEHKVDLLWRYGICLYDDGRYQEAETVFKQVVETRKRKLGANHPDTLKSIHNLAGTYMKQDRLEDAENLNVQVMKMMKTELGADHPDTLKSIHNLAVIYKKQGRLKEAEKLNLQLIKTRKIELGGEHPDTLKSDEDDEDEARGRPS